MSTCENMVGKRVKLDGTWLLRAKIFYSQLFCCSKQAERLSFHHIFSGPFQSVTDRQEMNDSSDKDLAVAKVS